MNDQKLIQNLQALKTIKPNNDWALSARANIVREVYSGTRLGIRSVRPLLEKTFARQAFAGVFIAALLLVLVGGMVWSQTSLPGSRLYPVKLVSEDVRELIAADKVGFEAARTEERVEEASKLASERLSEEEKVAVTEKLANYKKSLAEVKKAGDGKALAKAVQEVAGQTRLLTAAMSEINGSKTLTETLRAKTEERLVACTDEALAKEIRELLEEGSVPSLISAAELSFRCE